MTILTDPEKAAAASEVRDFITASGQTATLLRKQTGENLYGSDEGEFVEVCAFPLELSETPPKDLARQADALASVLPELMFAWRTVFVSRVETSGCRRLPRSRYSES